MFMPMGTFTVMFRKAAAAGLLAFLALPAWADPVADRLKAEVDKVIAAGPLKPGYWPMGMTDMTLNHWGDYNSDYWHNPADTVYYLLRARPHVPAATQSAIDTYLQNQFANRPFTQYTHVGWNTGAARNPTNWPPAEDMPMLAEPARITRYGAPDGWNFNPFNFYAAWKYAAAFGNAAAILDAMRNRFPAPPADIFFTHQPAGNQGPPPFALPGTLNAYIAGHMGYLELEKLATGSESSNIRATLNHLLALRLQLLDSLDPAVRPGPDAPGPVLRGTEAGGFMYLVPELADYLYQNRRARMQYYADTFDDIMPYWFVARSDEQLEEIRNGVMSNGGNGGSETSVTTLHFPHALFQARAKGLRASRAELEKFLDVPAFPVGDFYFMDNLVSILEAGAPPPPPEPNLLAGTGQAMEPGTAAPTPERLTAMISEAVAEARAAYGAGKPKTLLIANNAGGLPEAVSALQAEFGADVPIGGAGTANANYNTVTGEAFIGGGNRSLAVLALGGSDIEGVFMAQDNTLGQGGVEANVRLTGHKIAEALLPHIDPAKKNLIHLFGPGHNPNMIYILEGMKEILGDPVPGHIKIIGAAAANNGSSVANGTVMGLSVTGVLIQGDFNWAFRGIGPGFPGVPAQDAANAAQAVNTELGGAPDVLFFVPGHPDTDTPASTYADVHAAVMPVLGPKAVFGHTGGGEYGQVDTAAQPLAAVQYFFLAGLRASGATTVDTTPPASPRDFKVKTAP